MTNQQRTITQNKAIHKLFGDISDEMIGSGIDLRLLYEGDVDIPATPDSIKSYFRNIARTLYPEVSSTADLTTKQLQEVFAEFQRQVGQRTGIEMDFPSIDTLAMRKLLGKE